MNTTYDYVFSEFKDRITDPDLITFAEDLQTEMLIALMNKAITRCKRIVKNIVDLTLKDDTTETFLSEVPSEVIDIITEWMIAFWLEPYVNNIENLKNHLSTKDFSVFSPANLLEKISNRYGIARKSAKSLMNEYSFIIADMKELKT